jgi:hypothetical protein
VFKNNNSFIRADFATNLTQIPQDVLNRAAQRLLTLTAETVLPMAPNICKAVQKHFPALRNDYSSLSMELTASKLPGAERAQTLAKQLGQIMDRDASDAPVTLGAEDASIVEDLGWAREVRKALDDGLGAECAATVTACEEIDRLPSIGALEKLKTSSADLRNELTELLGREDFHLVASDIRRRKGEIESMVQSAGDEFAKELRTQLEQQIDGIQDMPEWGELPEADKAELAADMNSITIGDASNLAGIRALTNQQLEINARLNTTRAGVMTRWKRHKESKATPKEAAGTAQRVRIRPRYTASDVTQLNRSVEEMQGALEALKGSKVNEVLLEMDGVKYPEPEKKR